MAMGDDNSSSKHGWWTTLPGVITAIAGLIVAISGLVVALNKVGLLPSKVNDLDTSANREKRMVAEHPTEPQKKSTLDYEIVGRSRFQFAVAGRLQFYDFDSEKTSENSTNSSDFFFKADNPSYPNSKIGVVPLNGAKFAPKSAGALPWHIEPNQFTVAKGTYSIPQDQDIPCITSNRQFCTFRISTESKAKIVSSVVYKRIHH